MSFFVFLKSDFHTEILFEKPRSKSAPGLPDLPGLARFGPALPGIARQKELLAERFLTYTQRGGRSEGRQYGKPTPSNDDYYYYYY